MENILSSQFVIFLPSIAAIIFLLFLILIQQIVIAGKFFNQSSVLPLSIFLFVPFSLVSIGIIFFLGPENYQNFGSGFLLLPFLFITLIAGAFGAVFYTKVNEDKPRTMRYLLLLALFFWPLIFMLFPGLFYGFFEISVGFTEVFGFVFGTAILGVLGILFWYILYRKR